MLRDKLPRATLQELLRLDPDTVVVVGGTGAVSASVMSQVAAALPGTNVTRRWGIHRYDTAVAISQGAFTGSVDTVYVATGEGYTDALIAAPGAVADGAPLLLVRPKGLHGSVAAEIQRLSPNRIIIVGNDTAVPLLVQQQLEAMVPTVRRIGGSDPYAVGANFSADRWSSGAGTVYVARADLYPDALSAGPMTRDASGPILLVDTDQIPTVVRNELSRLDPGRIIILGGTGAVSSTVAGQLVLYFD